MALKEYYWIEEIEIIIGIDLRVEDSGAEVEIIIEIIVIQEEDSRREEFRIEGAQEEEIQILERIGDIRNIKWEKE